MIHYKEFTKEDYIREVRDQLMQLSDLDIGQLLSERLLNEKLSPSYGELKDMVEELQSELTSAQNVNIIYARNEDELRHEIDRLRNDIKDTVRFFRAKEELIAKAEQERYTKLEQEK